MAVLPSLAAAGYRFAEIFRVRWSEIDAQKIIFNGNYMVYIDEAFSEYLKMLSERYGAEHFEPVLARATQQFRAPGRMGDRLHTGARCTRIGRSSFTMQYEIRRESDEQLLLEGEFIYVSVDLATGRSTPLPDSVRGALIEFDHPEEG